MGHLRRTEMNNTIALLGAAALLAGCATWRIAWDKAGISPAERERDETIGTDGGGQFLAPYCIDREVYIQCMETRGYTIRSK